MKATKATASVQVPLKPVSSLKDASLEPVFELVAEEPGVVPAMTVPVRATDVAPSAAPPDPWPFATREEYAAAAPVAASSEMEAADSYELVGAAIATEDAGEVIGDACVSVVETPLAVEPERDVRKRKG
jgi:hypothetical protein